MLVVPDFIAPVRIMSRRWRRGHPRYAVAMASCERSSTPPARRCGDGVVARGSTPRHAVAAMASRCAEVYTTGTPSRRWRRGERRHTSPSEGTRTPLAHRSRPATAGTASCERRASPPRPPHKPRRPELTLGRSGRRQLKSCPARPFRSDGVGLDKSRRYPFATTQRPSSLV